jgi:hypothetical protein
MRTDELDLVRRFAQDGPEPPADFVDRARQRLTEAMATSAEVVPLITSSNKALDRRRRRFVLPAVAAVAVLALAGIAVGVTVSGGGSARPSTGVGVQRGSLAATELDRAARLVADDTTPVPGPGEYQYTETDSATLVALNSVGNLTPPDVTPSTMVGQSASSAPNPNAPDAGTTYRVWDETHAQSWVDANDNGKASFTFSTSFFSPQDKSVWQAAGSPQVDVDAGAPSTASLSASGFPDVAGLPTDPQALLRTLESGAYGAPDDPSAAFSAVGELLQDPKDTSPALRSALYQAAALIPGTEALGTIADHAGQRRMHLRPSSSRHAWFQPARSFLGGALWTLGSLRQFPPRQHHRMGRTVRAEPPHRSGLLLHLVRLGGCSGLDTGAEHIHPVACRDDHASMSGP